MLRSARALAIGVLLSTTLACRGADAPGDTPRQSLETGSDGVAFVEERLCLECHATQADAWRRSHHARAMQPAAESTVAGDFADATFTQSGVTTRFYRRGAKFLVDTEGPAGLVETYEVLYTFGAEPLQQYLVALPGGRLQALSVAWDVPRHQWFSLVPDERVAPGDPLHWTGRLQRWNDRCAECHSTDLRVRFDAESNTYATTWAAVNVGCQACHGPGARHVAWAAQSDTSANASPGAAGLVVDLEADRANQVWACAPCHSRRSRASPEDMHGRSYQDDFTLALLRPGLYYADGQIREEVYVTGSFLQSLMHRRGVVCTDCHDAHGATTLAAGNALCTRCHQAQPPATFPTLRAQLYDSPAHHRHEPGSAGAACVECHMPARTYMVVDPRRDHSLRIPRPDLARKLGTPDACTMCHTERTSDWAARAIAAWYARPSRPRHFGETLTAGRHREAGAEAALIELAADTTQPGIARATAVDVLSSYAGESATRAIVASLADPDPLIRLAAVEALAGRPPDVQRAALIPLLGDPAGSIRAAAARILAPQRRTITVAAERANLDAALDGYRATQLAQADQPESLHNLADLALGLGDPAEAERAYRRAIALDSTFVPSHVNLAMLYNQLGRNGEAEALLGRAVSLAPDEGQLHYSLGLLLAEMQRLTDAVAALERAAERMPDHARVHYNLGLARQALGRMDGAETALQRAWTLNSSEPDHAAGLAFFYRQLRRWDDARRWAERLAALRPGDPDVTQLLREIEAERRAR